MRPLLLVAVLASLAASCGGDDDDRPSQPRGVEPHATPQRAGRHDVIRVAFRARVSLGTFGDRRRAYVADVHRRRPMSGCVQQREGIAGRGRAGERVVARLDPRRGEGGELGWCAGRYAGKVTYSDGFACPDTGPCEPPEGFERVDETVGRFGFSVR